MQFILDLHICNTHIIIFYKFYKFATRCILICCRSFQISMIVPTHLNSFILFLTRRNDHWRLLLKREDRLRCRSWKGSLSNISTYFKSITIFSRVVGSGVCNFQGWREILCRVILQTIKQLLLLRLQSFKIHHFPDDLLLSCQRYSVLFDAYLHLIRKSIP